MKIGILGNTGVGKHTFFNILKNIYLEKKDEDRKKTNLLDIKVKNPDVDYLSAIYQPLKTTYASILFGLPENATGKLDDQAYLSLQRNYDGLLIIINHFEGTSETEAVTEIKKILSELSLSDYMVVEKRLERLKKGGKQQPNYDSEIAILEPLRDILETNDPNPLMASKEQLSLIKGFGLFYLKPKLILENCDDQTLKNPIQFPGLQIFQSNLKLEEEISLMNLEEQTLFLKELQIEALVSGKAIEKIYELAGLESFYTIGEDEIKAWTIERGTIAREAAAKIHSDIANRFISAEVVSFEDFVAYNGIKGTKAAGKFRLEKKDYIVKNRDIITFRFNK